MKKIAVVTPAFNAGKFIGECIESVGASVTLGEFEIEHIVVDDGSTDGTTETLAGLKRSNLRSVFLDVNGGAANARNKGIEMTDSDYVYFLDADDLLFANSLRYLYESKSQWTYGDFVRGDAEGKYITGQDYYGWNFGSVGEALTAMYTGRHFFQQNSLLERRIIEEVGMFDRNLTMADDFDLCTRILLSGINPLYIPGPLYMHRIHEHNLSSEYMLDPRLHKKDVVKLFEKYEQELKRILTWEQMRRVEKFIKNTEV